MISIDAIAHGLNPSALQWQNEEEMVLGNRPNPKIYTYFGD